MDSKVLLIDDRVKRKYDYLHNRADEFLKYVRNEILLPDDDKLSPFSLIMVHRSLLTDPKKNIINDFHQKIKESGKYLVIFSGGITQNQILENGKLLLLNSRDLYSERTIFFLKNYQEDRDMFYSLLYGNHPHLPMLIKLRQLMWKYDSENIKVLSEKMLEINVPIVDRNQEKHIIDFLNQHRIDVTDNSSLKDVSRIISDTLMGM